MATLQESRQEKVRNFVALRLFTTTWGSISNSKIACFCGYIMWRPFANCNVSGAGEEKEDSVIVLKNCTACLLVTHCSVDYRRVHRKI